MASIIGSERLGNDVILHIKMPIEDVEKLKGCMDNIHLVSEDNANIESAIYERGKKGCTKYFLIPKPLRVGVNLKGRVSCLRHDSENKKIWTYIIDNP